MADYLLGRTRLDCWKSSSEFGLHGRLGHGTVDIWILGTLMPQVVEPNRTRKLQISQSTNGLALRHYLLRNLESSWSGDMYLDILHTATLTSNDSSNAIIASRERAHANSSFTEPESCNEESFCSSCRSLGSSCTPSFQFDSSKGKNPNTKNEETKGTNESHWSHSHIFLDLQGPTFSDQSAIQVWNFICSKDRTLYRFRVQHLNASTLAGLISLFGFPLMSQTRWHEKKIKRQTHSAKVTGCSRWTARFCHVKYHLAKFTLLAASVIQWSRPRCWECRDTELSKDVSGWAMEMEQTSQLSWRGDLLAWQPASTKTC